MDRSGGNILKKMFQYFIFLLLLTYSTAQEPQVGQVPVLHPDQIPAQQPVQPSNQQPIQYNPSQQVNPGQQPVPEGNAGQQQFPQVPMQQVPMQQVPVQQVPMQQVPMQQVNPGQQPVPQGNAGQQQFQQVPMQQVPMQQVPMQQVHPGQIPMQQVHPGQMPMQPIHPGQVPPQPFHPGQVPMQQPLPGQIPVQVKVPPGQGPMAIPIPSSPVFNEDDPSKSPAQAMEYKVHVDPGKEECYFQYTPKGSTIYVSFQVVRGGDGMAGFAVRDPKGVLVHPYQWKAGSEFQDVEKSGGYYGICVDNQFSRFAAKLVNLYITTFSYDEWEEFSQEWEDINVSGENCTKILQGVDMRIQEILQHQQLSRSRESRDYNLLLDNQSYVQYWSLAQCAVVVGAFVVQVYFVKKLFDSKTNSKGRI